MPKAFRYLEYEDNSELIILTKHVILDTEGFYIAKLFIREAFWIGMTEGL